VRSGFRLNQIVNTPNGRGRVQGRLEMKGQPERILIAHTPEVGGEWVKKDPDWMGGGWVLKHYDPKDVTA
jgi:hypothetical protein